MKKESRKLRSKGKGHEDPCVVCGETRFTEEAHFPKPKEKGGEKTIFLCPTHHKLLDNGRLRRLEYEAIWESMNCVGLGTVNEFVEWSYQNEYPYSVGDLERKFWYDETTQIIRRLAVEETMLTSPIRALYVVEFGRAPFTVGAPHHARGGVGRLPCDRVSDENVGFLALDLARHLNGKCIVAANYWMDANKVDGDYVDCLPTHDGGVLVEIHGHGDQNANFDVEISCGTQALTNRSERLAQTISDIIEKRSIRGVSEEVWESIGSPRVGGRFQDIRFKATEACSVCRMRKVGGIPYHIEIPPEFRLGSENRVPTKGKVLIEVIAQAILRIHPWP